LGGETAEMPGFYPSGEYDIAGFCVGIVEKSQLLDGSQVEVGDIAIALPSSGVHSNGFSLVRKIVEKSGLTWDSSPTLLEGKSLGEVFLTPTQIYVQPILAALGAGIPIHGMAHITGGGLPENLPRCLNQNQSVQVDPTAWNLPPVFQWLAEVGEVSPAAMFETFNMGIGFVVIVPPTAVAETLNLLASQQIAAYSFGEVVTGSGEVLGLIAKS